jgi:hypothetical protein
VTRTYHLFSVSCRPALTCAVAWSRRISYPSDAITRSRCTPSLPPIGAARPTQSVLIYALFPRDKPSLLRRFGHVSPPERCALFPCNKPSLLRKFGHVSPPERCALFPRDKPSLLRKFPRDKPSLLRRFGHISPPEFLRRDVPYSLAISLRTSDGEI